MKIIWLHELNFSLFFIDTRGSIIGAVCRRHGCHRHDDWSPYFQPLPPSPRCNFTLRRRNMLERICKEKIQYQQRRMDDVDYDFSIESLPCERQFMPSLLLFDARSPSLTIEGARSTYTRRSVEFELQRSELIAAQFADCLRCLYGDRMVYIEVVILKYGIHTFQITGEEVD